MVTSTTPTRRRNLQLERDITEHAARIAGVSADELMQHAEGRAWRLSGEYVHDPMLVRIDVDQPRETREELADARNRLVWWLEDNPDHPAAHRYSTLVLPAICVAYAGLLDED